MSPHFFFDSTGTMSNSLYDDLFATNVITSSAITTAVIIQQTRRSKREATRRQARHLNTKTSSVDPPRLAMAQRNAIPQNLQKSPRRPLKQNPQLQPNQSKAPPQPQSQIPRYTHSSTLTDTHRHSSTLTTSSPSPKLHSQPHNSARRPLSSRSS